MCRYVEFKGVKFKNFGGKLSNYIVSISINYTQFRNALRSMRSFAPQSSETS